MNTFTDNALTRWLSTQTFLFSGHSCREQIAQATSRQALHIVEVAALALHRSRNTEAANHAGF